MFIKLYCNLQKPNKFKKDAKRPLKQNPCDNYIENFSHRYISRVARISKYIYIYIPRHLIVTIALEHNLYYSETDKLLTGHIEDFL